MSSVCLRLVNQDVIGLDNRVHLGTKVIVLPLDHRADNTSDKRS